MAETETTIRVPISLVPAVNRLLEVRESRFRGALVLQCDEGIPSRFELNEKRTGKIEDPILKRTA